MRYGEWIGRAALALIFLLNGLGVVDQTRAAHELTAHGAPAALVPFLLNAGHDFWAYRGAELQGPLVNFLKNLALLGGLCLVAFRTAPDGRPHLVMEHRKEVA